MALQVAVAKGEYGAYKVKLTGSLDSDTYQQFDAALEEVYADELSRAIRLEIEDLQYISSMGLGSIVKAKKAMHARGGVVTIIGAQPQVAKVFEIVRVLPKEAVFATREEADAYLMAIQKRVVEEQGDSSR